MIRRQAVLLVVLVGVAMAASAFFPAVLFWDVASSVVESLVVRQVGKVAIMTVGTAANDASWVTGFMSWLNAARVLGSLVVSVGGTAPATYEVSVTSAANNDLTKGPVVSQWWKSSVSMAASQSADGVAHTFSSPKTTDAAAAGVAYIAAWNSYANAANVWTHCPPDYGFSGAYYYVTFATSGRGCSDSAYVTTDNLVSVQAEQPDGVKRIKGSPSGGWSADSTDPDWSAADVAKFASMPAIRFEGVTTANGNKATLDVSAVNGSVALQYQEQVAPDQLRTMTMETNTSMVPYAVDQSIGAGSISLTPASTASVNNQSQPIIFPSDYARAGEAAGAAAIVTPKLDQLHHDLTDSTGTPPADPAIPTFDHGFGNTFGGLLSWQLPGHVSQCPTGEFDALGRHFVFDAHCALWSAHAGELSAASVVLWTLVALFVVLGA